MVAGERAQAIWQIVARLLPPNFFWTLASGAFGVFVGAWVTNRTQRKKAVITELNNIRAASVLCVSICNVAIGLKKQHVQPMRDAYERTQQEYQQAIAQARNKGPQPSIALGVDLQTIVPPKMPTDLLERCVFDEIAISGRALAASVQLIGAIDGLDKAIDFRNQIIADFRKTTPMSLRDIHSKYLGLKADAIVDRTFPACTIGIYEQTNDCIFFSRILAKDLLAYGNSLRRRHAHKLMLGLPRLEAVDWSNAERAGLMPDDKFYASWLQGFKPKLSKWQRFSALLASMRYRTALKWRPRWWW
jgi:hypothetical protein